MTIEGRLVEEAVGKFQKESCDAILIDEEYRNDGFLEKVRNLEKKIYKGNSLISKWLPKSLIFVIKNVSM
jgi:hypothetical protein